MYVILSWQEFQYFVKWAEFADHEDIFERMRSVFTSDPTDTMSDLENLSQSQLGQKLWLLYLITECPKILHKHNPIFSATFI